MRGILKGAKRWVGGARDRAAGELARLILNRFDLSKYGAMTAFTLDSENRELHGMLELKGEEKPVEFRAKFQIATGPEGKVLQIEWLWTSREWLTLLATEFLKPVPIPLPPGSGAVLKVLGL